MARKSRGSTLVELSIVMAVLSIITTMVVSFSMLVRNYVSKNQDQYDFIEEVADIRETISNWITTHDVAGYNLLVSDNSIVCKHGESEISRLVFDTERRELYTQHGDEKDVHHEDTIDSINFDYGANVLKCTANGKIGSKDEEINQVFIFSTKCATFSTGGGF